MIVRSLFRKFDFKAKSEFGKKIAMLIKKSEYS